MSLLEYMTETDRLHNVTSAEWRIVDDAYKLKQKMEINFLEVSEFVIRYSHDLWDEEHQVKRMWGIPVRAELDEALPFDTIKVAVVATYPI